MPPGQITEITMLVLAGLVVFAINVVVALLRLRKAPLRLGQGNSLSLFNICAATFIMIAALVIVLVRSQNDVLWTPALARFALSHSIATLVAQNATPGDTLSPSETATAQDTPTSLPSLTPTMSETPIVLYTPIVYSSTYALTTPTSCSVIANTATYLRGDPSEKMASIGTIFAGSLLNVTGRVANTQWWQVTSTDGDVSVEGWVRADFVTVDSACTDDAVPLIGPTATPTRVPKTIGSTSAVTAGPCTLLTTIAASLRPEPSLQQVPLAQIPEGTALTSLQKSANGQWWNVTYGDQNGWVGAGAVIASASCSAVSANTPTSTTP